MYRMPGATCVVSAISALAHDCDVDDHASTTNLHQQITSASTTTIKTNTISSCPLGAVRYTSLVSSIAHRSVVFGPANMLRSNMNWHRCSQGEPPREHHPAARWLQANPTTTERLGLESMPTVLRGPWHLDLWMVHEIRQKRTYRFVASTFGSP